MKPVLFALALSTLLAACVSNRPNAEFVNSITFSSLETFSYKHTLISGMNFRESESILLEELSESTLKAEFASRDFEEVEGEADFYVVTKWKKAVSHYPDAFDSIDGPLNSIQRRDDPSYRFAARLHLTVEVYENSTRSLFWRKHLPNSFDAVQLTEERVIDSLRRAVKHFPVRVLKDPSLPDIE